MRKLIGNISQNPKCGTLIEYPLFYLHCYFFRSAATRAADAGASSEQLKQHFGWKSSDMASHYITTSKKAITDVASKLAGVGEDKNVSKERAFSVPKNGPGGDFRLVRKEKRQELDCLFGDDSDDKEMMEITDMVEKMESPFSFPSAAKVYIIQGGTNTFNC